MTPPLPLTIAVEGVGDEAVARRICEALGLEVARVFVAGGKTKLDPKLGGYNNAARISPWLVLRDLDHDAECAAALRDSLLPAKQPGLLLRVPVRSLEAWLMGDRVTLARYLGIRSAAVPAHPETLDWPKQTLVNLARGSRSREIREAIVPSPGLSAPVGRGYTAAIIEYAGREWNPLDAMTAVPSLARCVTALRRLFQ